MKLDTFQAFKNLSSENFVQLSEEDFMRLQQHVIAIAFDIIDFCKAHDIAYVLIGGSCLGAVRHQGIIPWDDDVDLGMPRADFDRFRELFPSSELAERYDLKTPQDGGGHIILPSQVRAKETTFRGKDDLGDRCGIPVDIFVIEDIPDNALLRQVHGAACLGMGFLQSARKFAEYPEHYRDLAADNEDLKKATNLKIRIGNLLKFASLDTWTRKADAVYSLSRNESSRYVTLPSDVKHYFGEIQSRDVFFPVASATFEDRQVSIPHDPHRYLAQAYGEDYMTPPAETDRPVHFALELDFGTPDDEKVSND